MSISSLFKSGNLDDIKPKPANKLNPLTVYQSVSQPIPVANLFSLKLEAPTPAKVQNVAANTQVKEVIVEKIVEVPKEVIVEKIVHDESARVELEQVKALNTKYLQVINQMNEELMTVKTNEGKNLNVVAEAVKEKEELVSKVEELTKALLNVINQNKLLSRALGLRS
jgi:hypothetical protein